jgi:hypothetical protein
MINSDSSSLSHPLSPRPITIREKRSVWFYLIPAFLLLLSGFGAGYYFFLQTSRNEVSSVQVRFQINNGSSSISLGEYEVCDWAKVDFDTHVPLFVDGQDNGFFDAEDDILIEGVLCGSSQPVILALDDEGLHGSVFINGQTEQAIEPVDSQSSSFSTVEFELQQDQETEETEEVEREWKNWIEEEEAKLLAKNNGRRRAQQLSPGSVDIHLHLDIDYHMVETFGSIFAAARYGVELIGVVNRDMYFHLGFNLKVSSINVRSSYLSETSSAKDYLSELKQIPRPSNVNLLHSLSTRRLGGGIAYMGGLYNSWPYGVSGSLNGGFSIWDRYVVAHELGHNFGSSHTHDYDPPIETCGLTWPTCSNEPKGTIMSYCHMCSGGYDNLNLVWADRVRERLLNSYDIYRNNLAARTECQTFSTTPDIGVPFYLKGNSCVSIDTSQCTDCPAVENCSEDSIWQFDGSRIVSAANSTYCWSASSTDCDSISLQSCDSSTEQQFGFQGTELVSETCGTVKYNNELAGFNGEASISHWCLPEVEYTTTTVVETTLESTSTTVPETTLDSTSTTVPETTLESISTSIDVATTDIPTINPTVLPTLTPIDTTFDSTPEPTELDSTSTLNPTQTPTTLPTAAPFEDAYGCVFGCEESRTSCHKDFQISHPCTANSPCDLTGCIAHCDANADCRYVFSNNRGGCLLYDDCSRSRGTRNPGVTRQRLSNSETTTEEPKNLDCMGSWSVCTSACEKSGQRTFTVTQAQSGTGQPCPTTAPDCVPGQGSCVEGTDLPTTSPTTEPTTEPTTNPSQDSITTTTTGPVFQDLYGSSDAPSRTSCHNQGRISRVCSASQSCSKDQCENLCGAQSECRFFFSNVRGGCHLYRSCDRTRNTGHEGWTRARLN